MKEAWTLEVITLKGQIGYSENESIAQNLLVVNEARAAGRFVALQTHAT